MAQVATTDGDSADSAGLSVPGSVRVDGKVIDVETNYLPHVIDCENPGSPPEAMKAQAVAARTWLTANAGKKQTPTISDSTSAQVYSCAANYHGTRVSAAAIAAAQATRGEVVLWNGAVTAGFFVAGSDRKAGSCRAVSDPTTTERDVTFNFGYIEGAVRPSSIGSASNSTNRGCFSQKMANCLAESVGYDYGTLLRYFYGSDIQVAPLGTSPMDDSIIMWHQGTDLPQATCYSTTFARPVPVNGCLQSGANQTWFQCLVSGKFTPISVDSDGNPVGGDNDCTVALSL